MSTGRRAASNSPTAAVDAFRQANARIEWPSEIEPLQDLDQQAKAASAFDKVIATRSPADWTSAAVIIAARWAKSMILSDSLTMELEREGWVIPSAKNPAHMLRNPKADAVASANQICLALSRMLNLSGGEDRRTLGNNRRAVEAARATVQRDGDGIGSLLAQPPDDFSLLA